MRYRVEFDRPTGTTIVPREIKRAAADEPLGIFAKPTSDQLFAIVEAKDKRAAGYAAVRLCAKGDYHFYPSER